MKKITRKLIEKLKRLERKYLVKSNLSLDIILNGKTHRPTKITEEISTLFL